MNMNINLRSRTMHTYSSVMVCGRILRSILENEFYISDNLISDIVLAEKVESKFSKPVSPLSKYLYVFIGGWRLIGQDREKINIHNPELYGKCIGFSSTLYAPASSAEYVVKTESGLAIAEVIQYNMVNILFDICSTTQENIKFLLRNIFKDIMINYYKIDLSDLERKAIQEKQSAVTEFLISLASRDVKNAENSAEQLRNEIKRYEDYITDAIQKRNKFMAEAEGFRAQCAKGVEGLNEELQKLRNINSIRDVSVDGDRKELVLHTNDIYIINGNKRYYIGEFEIRINPTNCNVVFNNKGNCRRSYWGPSCHHPHIDQRGNPCWGNVHTAINVYIKQNEYQAVASLLIGFLESVNTSDPAGKNITSWDVVNKAGEVIQGGYNYTNPPIVNVCTCYECQDSFNRNDILLSKGDMHICRHCADKYVACHDCGDIRTKDDMETCDRCDTFICEDCYDDSVDNICHSCIEAERVLSEIEEGQSLCPFCKNIVNDDELHTCETCGEQGCGTCITFNGRYSCPNHA